jgi:hypothetical protein
MGFGSYDESEQESQGDNDIESDALNVHENDHDGEIGVTGDASSEELLDQLSEMKDEDEE